MTQSRKPYPSDVSDEEWALVAPYLALLPEESGQRVHALREVFNGLRYMVKTGAPWRWMPNVSIGPETDPRIGEQEGPPGDGSKRQRSPRRSWSGLRSRGERGSVRRGGVRRSGAVLEAPAVVAGLDDVAVMGEAIEQRGRHLWVAEDAWPFAEGEIGGDDDRGALLETADQVEQQLPAGLREGEIAEFVEDHEVEAWNFVVDDTPFLGSHYKKVLATMESEGVLEYINPQPTRRRGTYAEKAGVIAFK